MKTWICRPNGPGDYAQWAPSPAGANWQRVSSNSDSEFVQAAVPNVKDLYTIESLPPNAASVSAVRLMIRVSSDANTGILVIYKDGSVATAGQVSSPPESPATFMLPLSLLSPTVASVNAMQIGQFLPGLPPNQLYAGLVYVQDVWLEVDGEEATTVFAQAKIDNSDIEEAVASLFPTQTAAATTTDIIRRSVMVPS